MSTRFRSFFVLIQLGIVLGSGSLFASFQEGFHLPGPSSGIATPVVFDDGSGPKLFAIAGDTVDAQPSGVYTWDGERWSPVAGPAGGLSGTAVELAVFDSGGGPELWALGQLSSAGGQPAALAAVWDGTNWRVPVDMAASPTGGVVYCATVFDDGTGAALYAGGFFDIGGQDLAGVLRWTGTEWLQVGAAFDSGYIVELATYDPGGGERLYASGRFPSIGGVPMNGIAGWDGTAWSALPGPSGIGITQGTARRLLTFDAGDGVKLYATGSFYRAGGLEVSGLATWDGSEWSAPSLGLNVSAAVAHDFGAGEILVLAHLLEVGVQGTQLSTWDGQQVVDLPASFFNKTVSTLDSTSASGESFLIAGGLFEQAGGVVAHQAAVWTGAGWGAMSDGEGQGVDRRPFALEVFDDGTGAALYVGGSFDAAGTAPAEGLARWTSQGWETVEDGTGQRLRGDVHALKSFDGGTGAVLMIGGRFTIGESQEFLRLAAWDGGDWIFFADHQPGDRVLAMEVFDAGAGPELYIGGSFDHFGSVEASRIVRFDGVTAAALPGSVFGEGVNDEVEALETYGDQLYVGGSFDRAGNVVSLGGLARWDGASWSALPVQLEGHGGSQARVLALEVHDAGDGESLYVAGEFARSDAGEDALFNIAVWDEDSATFQGLGAGVRVPGTTIAAALGLLSFDPGDGASLFVIGDFSHAGPVESRGIARWQGARWRAVGGPDAAGLGGFGSVTPSSMAAFDDGVHGLGLFVGGDFSSAGGVVSESMAFFRLTPELFADGFESGDLDAWSASFP